MTGVTEDRIAINPTIFYVFGFFEAVSYGTQTGLSLKLLILLLPLPDRHTLLHPIRRSLLMPVDLCFP